jgi:pimeloyl-ACP methyl ester carboxylesterase
MILAHDVQTRDIRMRYLEAGASGAPPLLLLHGWPEWSHVWRPVINRLQADFRLLAPDLRGFGESEKTSFSPALDATPDQLADDILAFMDALDLERAGFVAHDVGSFVAQALALKAPSRVRALFLFNCGYPGIGARWVEPDHLREVWYQFFHQQPWAAKLIGASRDTCRLYFREFLRHWSYRKDAFDGDLEAWVDNFMRPGNMQGGFNWYASNHAGRMAVIKGLAPPPPPIILPTRVFWGRHDPVLKVEWTDRLPEFFTDLELSIAEEAGHFVHYEMPDASAQEIRRFFGRVPK